VLSEEYQMPRAVTESTSCFLMQIPPAEKARLMRAAALERTSLKNFMLRHALLAAEAVIEKSERLALDEEQIRFMRDLLDNPPPPSARLVVAATAYAFRK
jgi:uncharacterized protein (DUF1778 family)